MEKFDLFLQAKASEEEDRTIEYIATKEIVDSMGRVFKISGMDLSPLKQLKSIYWNHFTDQPPIAKAEAVKKHSGDEVRIVAKFATPEEYGFADTIYKLVKGGYINGGSVGISADIKDVEYPDRPTKINGKDVKMIVHKSKLHEFSITPNPANMAAVPLNAAMKDGIIDEVEAKEFELMCKQISKNDNSEEKTEQNINDENVILKSRIAELELLLKEKVMEDENEDSIYASLYDEFKVQEKESNDNLLDEFFEDKDDQTDSLLDEFFEKD
jgi:hypothetical protein